MSPMNILVLIIELLCSIYFLFKMHNMKLFKNLNKLLSWLFPSLIIVIYILISFTYLGLFSVLLVHYFVFMGLADLIFFIINRFRKNKIRIHLFIAFIFSTIYIGISLFLGLKVFMTNYSINTEKTNKSLKIAMISDVHLGNTLSGNKFKDYILEIEEKNPDILVIVGDFVDDETKKEDMIIACDALGNMNTKYGIYYVDGNHDKGYYEDYRNFKMSEFLDCLTKNNVNIINDKSVLINDDFYLIGREDKSYKDRKDVDELVESLDDSKYKILLDHQPNDYDNEKGKADLVLSGHTHGGNIFPINFIVYAANDNTYGKKIIDDTTFIVSSGISEWFMPYNNVTIQEYVIIEINGN